MGKIRKPSHLYIWVATFNGFIDLVFCTISFKGYNDIRNFLIVMREFEKFSQDFLMTIRGTNK